MHTPEKMKSVEIWAPKPSVHWGAARHKMNTDGIADCCKRTVKDAGHYSVGYYGPCDGST